MDLSLSGQTSIFGCVFFVFKSLLGIERQKKLKALVNEDTLLPMMFLGMRKLGNIGCGQEMFLNKIRNIFVLDTKFVSATNVARAGKRGNICVGNNGCLPSWQTDRSEIGGNTCGKWNDIFRLNRANQ